MKAPEGFDRNEYAVNGVRTVVYSAGRGDPLLFFHGAGTFSGIDFSREWTRRYRVILPFHPGYGESADEPRMTTMGDYLLHYLDLCKVMRLESFALVGISLGGWMAAEFAVAHGHMVRKLVLAAPAGLLTPEIQLPNLAGIAPEQLYHYLVHDLKTLHHCLPKNAEEEGRLAALMGRERQTSGRIAGSGPFNPNLDRWLHRVTMPTLLIWPTEDRLLPAALAPVWMRHLPNARLELLDNCGHLVFDESAQARELVTKFLA